MSVGIIISIILIQFSFSDLANIARAVSRSYCGSEISETDIYSPYSFYGSEAGTDTTSDLHDGWNASQVWSHSLEISELPIITEKKLISLAIVESSCKSFEDAKGTKCCS